MKRIPKGVKLKGEKEPRATFQVNIVETLADLQAELKTYGDKALQWYNEGKVIAIQAKVRANLPETGVLDTAKAQALADAVKPGERVAGVKAVIGASANDFGKAYAKLVGDIKAGVAAALEVQKSIAKAAGNMEVVNKLIIEYGSKK